MLSVMLLKNQKGKQLLIVPALTLALISCGEKENAEKTEVASAEASVELPSSDVRQSVTPTEKLKAEVMVLASSEIPNPQSAPYADCLTHIQAKVLSQNGKMVQEERILNLVTWAFKNREWDRGGLLRRGCRLQIEAVDFFTGTSEAVQQMQRVDDINDFDSPTLWLEKWILTEGVLASFQLPPREETVAKQVELIQHILAGYGDVVVGGVRDGWFFDLKNSGHYRPEFWKGYEHRNPSIQGSYKAIVTFHKQLAERGIKLHVAIAPRSATIYPDLATNVRYDPKVHGRVNKAVEAFIAELRNDGLDVIDLTPDLLAHRYYKFKYVGDGEQHYPVFLQNDHHWSPIGVRIAAKTIARHLLEGGHLSLPDTPLNFVEKKHLMGFSGVPYADWIHPPYNGIDQVFDTPYYTLIPKDESAQNSLRGIIEGPVHLIGDSFTWCHKAGNNLISHLTKELRQPLVFTGAAGGAETNVRQTWVKRHGEAPVKHVIWLIGENALADHERWHFVRFDNSDVLNFDETSFELSSSHEGGEMIVENSPRNGMLFKFGTEALPAAAKTKWTLTSKEPLTLKSNSFFHAGVKLSPVIGEEVPNASDYRFRLLVGDKVAAEKFEKTTDLNWERDWREELSAFAGVTDRVTIEVEVTVGAKEAQEGFPVVLAPHIEGVKK